MSLIHSEYFLNLKARLWVQPCREHWHLLLHSTQLELIVPKYTCKNFKIG